MNCYIHLDKPAVATCHECGMGLCRDCVDNSAYTIDNHPLCHDCNLKQASADLADAKSKKIWSLVKFILVHHFVVGHIDIFFYRRYYECLDICWYCWYSGCFQINS